MSSDLFVVDFLEEFRPISPQSQRLPILSILLLPDREAFPVEVS